MRHLIKFKIIYILFPHFTRSISYLISPICNVVCSPTPDFSSSAAIILIAVARRLAPQWRGQWGSHRCWSRDHIFVVAEPKFATIYHIWFPQPPATFIRWRRRRAVQISIVFSDPVFQSLQPFIRSLFFFVLFSGIDNNMKYKKFRLKSASTTYKSTFVMRISVNGNVGRQRELQEYGGLLFLIVRK